MFEPLKLKEEYDKLGWGKARLSGIQYAINQADMAKDYSYMLYFRYEYANSCGEAYDGLLRNLYLVFPEMLKIFEEHPDIQMPDCCYLTAAGAVWDIFGDVVNCADFFYQIPLSDMEEYFRKFRSFSLEFGYSLKDYYVASARFYRAIDKKRAWESFEEYKKLMESKHILNANTIAFQCEMEVYYGNIDKGLEILKPLIEGKYYNDHDLVFEYGRIFYCYLIREPDIEKAKQYYELMEGLRKKLRIRPIFFMETILYLVLTDFDAAWKFYKKEAAFQAASTIPIFVEEFATGSVIMMGSLAKKGRKQIHIRFPNELSFYREDGCYDTRELAVYFDKEAREIANKFDIRNGNHEEMEEHKRCLTLAKLSFDE